MVNAAGVTGRKRLHETSEDESRRVVDVNQVGTFLGMKAVAEPMRAAGGGSIVNLSSVAGIRGASNALAMPPRSGLFGE